jgi:cyclopropane fatty-acyl-phospholipid synthase-like methyltransferase
MASDYVPDHLFARLFQPWTLPESEWTLCKEDWARVDAICALPWKGRVLDVGSGDGTLAAMVCSRNPLVENIDCLEPDRKQWDKLDDNWGTWPLTILEDFDPFQEYLYDSALCCEVLEHLTPEAGLALLKQIKTACKPGAMVCVTVPCCDGSRAHYPGHIRLFEQEAIELVIKKSGLRLDWCGGVFTPGVFTTYPAPPIWWMVSCHA